MNSWIGERGRWAEDNDLCEIVRVVDEGAGVYEFKSLDNPDEAPWIGFIDEWMWVEEDDQC